MLKFKYVIISLVLLLLSGCSNTSIAVIGEPLEIDNSEPIATIDYAHQKVHEGSHYNYRDYYMLSKNTDKEFLLVTPAIQKEGHLILGFDATTSTIIVELFEDATFSNIGTIEPVINRNRNSNKTNTILLYEDPVIITDGLELASGIFGAGKKSNGDADRDTQEIILKQNTTYLIRITETNIQNTNINILFDWYENSVD